VYLTEDDVRREIRRGRDELNADKIILSGGEGSIHPKFIDFVRYAREVGYSRVQTVTNGYMFSRRDFYMAAVEAGLGEITFSLHGHTPELHDRLTGTPGAFHKLMKGMMRAIREAASSSTSMSASTSRTFRTSIRSSSCVCRSACGSSICCMSFPK